MIKIEGKLINCVQGEYTVRAGSNRGEIVPTFTAQILHYVGRKLEIEDIKLEREIFAEWKKLEGSDISVPIRAYAIADENGGKPKMGYSLATRTELPVVLKAVRPQTV